MVRHGADLEFSRVGLGLEDRKFLASWASFALAAVPGALGSVYATARLAPSLTPLALAEWALLGVLMTVFGSISQLGMKPGYMQAVTDLGPTHRFGALRAGVVLQAVTGTLAGSILAVALVVAHRFGYWQSVALLPWLPLQCALGNVAMMFHTDLENTGAGPRRCDALGRVIAIDGRLSRDRFTSRYGVRSRPQSPRVDLAECILHRGTRVALWNSLAVRLRSRIFESCGEHGSRRDGGSPRQVRDRSRGFLDLPVGAWMRGGRAVRFRRAHPANR
jgi:hypothetical protein